MSTVLRIADNRESEGIDVAHTGHRYLAGLTKVSIKPLKSNREPIPIAVCSESVPFDRGH